MKATREAEGTYSAEITGLTPSTTYEYRLVLTNTESNEVEYIPSSLDITTENAPGVPNGGFETTSNAESGKYKSFYDPSSPEDSPAEEMVVQRQRRLHVRRITVRDLLP